MQLSIIRGTSMHFSVVKVFGVFAKLASVGRLIVSDVRVNFSQLLAVLVCWVQKVVFTTRKALVFI